MKLSITKMHGAANDFVVIDATERMPALSLAQWRWLADRHRGVGADQILIVQRPDEAQCQAAGPEGLDFVYRIINADGHEVEQCGNGARCFVRFVHDAGLTDKTSIRVLTKGGIINPQLMPDGQVQVNMGEPSFDPAALPFSARGLMPEGPDSLLWPLVLERPDGDMVTRRVSLVSMGNPHAVQVVADVNTAPVELEGPLIESHPRFPNRVNAGFMQILSRREIALRVHERGAGETLACGTGACAAVVSGIRQGLLDDAVLVHARGGDLRIHWAGSAGRPAPVLMTGPAVTVFTTEVEVPVI
ncbi:MAG: diaminopimelate epimerase [Lautropia sp.]|nr:diaminopimelate epimerase [Lautropia sp.]